MAVIYNICMYVCMYVCIYRYMMIYVMYACIIMSSLVLNSLTNSAHGSALLKDPRPFRILDPLGAFLLFRETQFGSCHDFQRLNDDSLYIYIYTYVR